MISLIPIGIGLTILLVVILFYITRPGPLDLPPSCLEEAIVRKAVSKIKWNIRPPFCGMIEQLEMTLYDKDYPSGVVILGHPDKRIRIQFDVDKVKITSMVYNAVSDVHVVNLVHPDSIEHLSKAIETKWSEMLKNCNI